MCCNSGRGFGQVVPGRCEGLASLICRSSGSKGAVGLIVPGRGNRCPGRRGRRGVFMGGFIVDSSRCTKIQRRIVAGFVGFLTGFGIRGLCVRGPPLRVDRRVVELCPGTRIGCRGCGRLAASRLLGVGRRCSGGVVKRRSIGLRLLRTLFPLALECEGGPMILLFCKGSKVKGARATGCLTGIVNRPVFEGRFSVCRGGRFTACLFKNTRCRGDFTGSLLSEGSGILLLSRFSGTRPSFRDTFCRLFSRNVCRSRGCCLALGGSVVVYASGCASLGSVRRGLNDTVCGHFSGVVRFSSLDIRSGVEVKRVTFRGCRGGFGCRLSRAAGRELGRSCVRYSGIQRVRRVVRGAFTLSAVLDGMGGWVLWGTMGLGNLLLFSYGFL